MAKNNSVKSAGPSLIFIFGGTGDLNHRKLTPALYNLFVDGFLAEDFEIVGLGRSEYSDKKFQDHLLDGIAQFSRRSDDGKGPWKEFVKHLSYLKMDASKESDYQLLEKKAKRSRSKVR